MTDVGSARVEVTGDVRNFARQTERDLDRALSRVKVDPVKVGVDVDKDRVASTFISAGSEAASQMTASIGRGLGGLSSALSSNPFVALAGVALATALVATAAPAIGALLSGAVIGGAGIGVIGLGAWLLREEPALKAAAKSLTDTLKVTFTDAAKPLLGPLVGALKTFQALIKQITPQIKEMFKGLADSGAIESLATGIAEMVRVALPGFQELIKASGPFLKSLGESLPVLGAGLSVFFSAIADSGPGAAVFFKDFVAFIAISIASLGVLLGWLTTAYPVVRQFFLDAASWVSSASQWLTQFGLTVSAAFSPLVPIVTGVWRAISAVVGAAWGLMVNAVTTGIGIIRGVIAAVSAAIRGDWNGTWNAIKSVASAALNGVRSAVSIVMNSVRSAVSGAISAIRAAWSVGWNAMVSSVTGAASRVRSAVSGLAATLRGAISSAMSAIRSTWSAGWNAMVSSAASGASRVRSVVNGLRRAVTGAFSGAGSWLASAGRRIIDGLISGIRAGFGRVQGLLNSLTSLLPDWKGPAEVDRKILQDSGRLVMQGFEGGLESQFSSIRKTLGDLTGDLPTFTASASAATRGGDGASTASLGSNTSVTIQAGAIVIQGQGREAGEQAVEAVLERLGAATLVR